MTRVSFSRRTAPLDLQSPQSSDSMSPPSGMEQLRRQPWAGKCENNCFYTFYLLHFRHRQPTNSLCLCSPKRLYCLFQVQVTEGKVSIHDAVKGAGSDSEHTVITLAVEQGWGNKNSKIQYNRNSLKMWYFTRGHAFHKLLGVWCTFASSRSESSCYL